MRDVKILILACPCSGTEFTSKFLQSLGFDFGHERIGKNGGIGWHFVLEKDVTINTLFFPKANFDGFDYILHQVRDPREVVMTLPYETHDMWRYAEEICDLTDLIEMDRHYKFWYEWNILCRDKAKRTYRVEDLPHIIDSKTGTKRRWRRTIPKLTWDEVKEWYPDVYNLSIEFGYGGKE